MTNNYIQQYCKIQHESFCNHIKAMIDAFDKVLEQKDNQVTDQQRAVVHSLKAIYVGEQVADIERDLAIGHVTMETVQKRIQLEEEACKLVIEKLSPSPMWKVFLELIVAEQINAMRANLSNLVLWINNVR